MAPSQPQNSDKQRSYDKWSTQESLCLLTLLYEGVINNWRNSNGSIPKATVETKILPDLREKIGRDFSYNNYQARLKWYKIQYAKFQVLKKFSSGFGWDSVTKRFTANEEIWEEYFKSHPNDRNLKTDTVDGWDMLEVVVGRVLSTGDSQAGISAVASDVVGQSTRNFGQTRGVEDDDFEETLDMNIDGTPIQPRDAHNEDNRAFEATTGSQRKRPREDGSTSRGVPCTLDFTELTGKIDEISFTFQGIHNIMDQARVTKERERAEKAKERALRVGDPWEALREIPEIDNPTRYKVLRMLKERNEDRSFLRMTLEERKGWIHYNLSAEQPYYPAFDRN